MIRKKFSALVAAVLTYITAAFRTPMQGSTSDSSVQTVVSGVSSQLTNLQYKSEDSLDAMFPSSDRPQTGGSHYQLPIQPLDYIAENGLDYMQGNVVKYVTRHKSKNGVEDIRKAIDYCYFILEKDYDISRDN